MKRREFIAATAALLVSPRRSRAQGTPRRLGFLGPCRRRARPATQSDAWLGELARERLDRGQKPDHRLSIFWPTPGSTASFSRRPDCSESRCAHRLGTASSRSPEIGNGHHSDCIRGCGRSRRARPRPKPIASRRQHNGFYDQRAGKFPRQTYRNPPGTGSWRLENCVPGQSGQPNAQASISRRVAPHSPER